MGGFFWGGRLEKGLEKLFRVDRLMLKHQYKAKFNRIGASIGTKCAKSDKKCVKNLGISYKNMSIISF